MIVYYNRLFYSDYSRHLPALTTPRESHACGSYALAGGQVVTSTLSAIYKKKTISVQQMLIVTGGTGPDGDLASTEVACIWKLTKL